MGYEALKKEAESAKEIQRQQINKQNLEKMRQKHCIGQYNTKECHEERGITKVKTK